MGVGKEILNMGKLYLNKGPDKDKAHNYTDNSSLDALDYNWRDSDWGLMGFGNSNYGWFLGN